MSQKKKKDWGKADNEVIGISKEQRALEFQRITCFILELSDKMYQTVLNITWGQRIPIWFGKIKVNKDLD